MNRTNARRLLPLLLLAVSLTGCASRSPVVVKPAQIPPPSPELMTPEPSSGSYSARAQESFRQWQQRLTGSQPK